MHKFSTFLVLLMIVFQVQAQNTNLNCSANLNVDAVMEEVEITHYIFTGSDTTGLNAKLTTITVMEGKSQMVKKRKPDCMSANLSDCMIEVIEDIPAVTMNMYTLEDVSKTNDYDIRKEKIKVVKRPAGQVDQAIVCTKNRSANLIRKVQQSLLEAGYPIVVNGELDQATKLSLNDYQKSKGLAYGDLTLEVLSSLNVR